MRLLYLALLSMLAYIQSLHFYLYKNDERCFYDEYYGEVVMLYIIVGCSGKVLFIRLICVYAS